MKCRGRRISIRGRAGRHSEQLYGAAIDIGTTTVAVFLENLTTGKAAGVESFVNPQAAYGHDVISRIRHAMNDPQGLSTLRMAVVEGINEALNALCRGAGVSHEAIIKASVAGNPTMLHLFCGVDPSSIARAPYSPVFTKAQLKRGGECGLSMNRGGAVLVLPSISGFVGADVVAGIAATPVTGSPAFSLYLDIGTNGEMALGNREGLFCCSSAAGPAFEGATIRCGMGAVEGAICSFKNGRYKTIGGRLPVGICGSGIVDIVAHLLSAGTIRSDGYMENDYRVERGERTATGSDIVLTPQDVRSVQLAKAAIRSGITILMKTAGIAAERIKRVYCAGAFGAYLNIGSAAAIGMIPQEFLGRVTSVGNAAGYGARLALRSLEFEKSLQKIVSKARYIELSGREDFNEEFVRALEF